MANFEVLIKGGNLYKGGGELVQGMDIALAGGRIAAVRPNIPQSAGAKVIDAGGLLISPSFLDTHMHIDESFTMDDDDTLSLMAAIDNQVKSNDKYFDWNHDRILTMILKNAGHVIEMCIANGTGLLKTNVLFTPAWKTIALEAMAILREQYKGQCDVQTCVGFPALFAGELERAAKDGKVDYISGYPYMDEDYWATIDSIFERARRFGLPVDIHCGESDAPNIDCFLYFLDKAAATGMHGRITCGHITSLSAYGMDERLAEQAIRKAAEVRLNVTSLTSCNLYLSSMNRRGPTRIRQFIDAGVNVAIASDNIRDTFRPYGNCDLLAEALLTAKVNRYGDAEGLRKVFDMITYNASKNAMQERYGLEEGCPGSLVVLDAPTPEEAIRSQAEKLYVLKDGAVVAERGERIRS